MQLSKIALLGCGLISGSFAHPVTEERAAPVQVAHLRFHGGPAAYDLAIPADGTVVKTNNNMAVNIIDANDYNAFFQCTFNTVGEKTLGWSIDTKTGDQHILVGPPLPITSVSCVGTCVPTYSDCYVNGQSVGACCNGLCAANKCRPWTTGISLS